MTSPSFYTADATFNVADVLTKVREVAPVKGRERVVALTKRIAELEIRGFIKRQEYNVATTSDLLRQHSIQTRAHKAVHSFANDVELE